jgi:hypothetical protein
MGDIWGKEGLLLLLLSKLKKKMKVRRHLCVTSIHSWDAQGRIMLLLSGPKKEVQGGG